MKTARKTLAKKGQGISINVIVIAAIALLILVILSVLVIRSGTGIKGGTSCEALGGSCVRTDLYSGKCDADGIMSRDRGGSCDKTTDGVSQICCRTI